MFHKCLLGAIDVFLAFIHNTPARKPLQKMKIALVHEMLVKMGGAERVLAVLQDMFPTAPIYTLLYDEKKCGETFPQEKIVSSHLQKYLTFKVPRQLLAHSMPRTIEAFDFSGFDLVISSSSAFAHGILTPVDTKHICYCHAPMRYAWDYTHTYFEKKSAGILSVLKKPILRSVLHKLRVWDTATAGRADILLANSQTTKQRIQKFWRKDSQIVFPPVDLSRFAVGDTHEGYFLIISALTEFKRIDLAVRAFENFPKHKLLVIGEGAERAKLERIAPKNVEFLGRKNDADTAELLKHCRALLFPGLEDFGIVPVEAMASGKPVIAYGKGGVTETVVDEKTGVFFPELSSESMETAIVRFFELERKKVFSPKTCRLRAEQFSEEKFRGAMQKIVNQVIGG